jgi:hypothetical protein
LNEKKMKPDPKVTNFRQDLTAAVAEENAKIGWRRLELQQAKSALALLPKVTAILMEVNGSAEERLARMREALLEGGGRLLIAGGEQKQEGS